MILLHYLGAEPVQYLIDGASLWLERIEKGRSVPHDDLQTVAF
jgi:hypothetical protein